MLIWTKNGTPTLASTSNQSLLPLLPVHTCTCAFSQSIATADLAPVTFFLCVRFKHSCHFSSGSLFHNQNFLFLRLPLVSWHVKMYALVFKPKWSQIFSPTYVQLVCRDRTLEFAFSSSAIRKGRNIAAFANALQKERVWLEMIVREAI